MFLLCILKSSFSYACIFVTAYMRASCTLRAVTCAASCSIARFWKPSLLHPVVLKSSFAYACIFVTAYMRALCTLRAVTCAAFGSLLLFSELFVQFRPRIVSDMRFFFVSIPSIFTFTISPTLTTSSGCFTYLSASWEICTRPS